MAAYAVSSADPAVCWRITLEGQRDPIEAARLVALLLDHGVEVRLAADKKSFLVATAQPYGRFVDEMMGIQRYPEVHPAAGSGILEPYDVAAWSLPLMMGVRAERAKVSAGELAGSSVLQSVPWPAAGLAGSGKYFSVAGQQNNIFALSNAMQKAGADVYLARGKGEAPAVIFAAHPDLAASAERLHLQLRARADLPEGASKLKPLRLGLFKPYIASLDEGWTRFILEQYGFPTKNLDNKEVKAGNLNAAYDVIILPDSPRNVIVEGRGGFGGEGFGGEFPPEYTGGIGKEGLKALGEFVENGGTLVALANASSVLTGEEFNLPVRNTFASGEAVRGAQATGINIPGSLLRVYVDPNHPVGYGMPGEIAAFFDAPLAFETSPPSGDVNRSVVAWYPESAKDILVSGYARGADRLEHKAAIVAFTKGKGKIVLFGFRTQFRAQTEGTFQLLFNAIRWAGL